MQKYKFTKKQTAEIKSAYEAAANKAMASHLEMLYLRAVGIPVKEICKRTGACKGTVYRLTRDYHTIGLTKMLENLQPYYTSVDRYMFTPEQTAEIRDAFQTATDEKNLRRLESLYLCAKGESASNAARRCNVRPQTIQRLVLKYKENGIDPIIGNTHRDVFTPEQMAEIRAACEAADNGRVRRRLTVLLLRGEGVAVPEIADRTSYTTASVNRLTKEYLEHGLANITQTRRTKVRRPAVESKYRFNSQQKAEIEAARKYVTEQHAAKKLEALWLRTEKKKLSEISAATGLHIQTVNRLVRNYFEYGLEAVIKKSGRTKLPVTYEDEHLVLELLREKTKQGYPVRTADVRAAFEKLLGHSVSNTWTVKLLRKHHWQPASVWMPPMEKL